VGASERVLSLGRKSRIFANPILKTSQYFSMQNFFIQRENLGSWFWEIWSMITIWNCARNISRQIASGRKIQRIFRLADTLWAIGYGWFIRHFELMNSRIGRKGIKVSSVKSWYVTSVDILRIQAHNILDIVLIQCP
jgi:hypothetical protein